MKIGRGSKFDSVQLSGDSASSLSRGAKPDKAATAARSAPSDKIGHAVHKPALIPEPLPPPADFGSKLPFKGTRLKLKEAFRPSDAALEKKITKYDGRIATGLDKRDENVRKTVANAGTTALTDNNVTRTVLKDNDRIKAAIGPQGGKDPTFTQGVSVGALDAFTAKSAERAGMSVEDYVNPGKRVKVKAAATALPTVGGASNIALKQKQLDHNAKHGDRAEAKLDDLREKRAQEQAGTTAVHGATRYYDPVADIDQVPKASRTEAVDFHNGLPDALNNKRRLDYDGADASLKPAKNDRGVAAQVQARDARAKELEAKFPQQHNETLQAWGDRNAAQQQLVHEGAGGALNGLVAHRPDTHLGTDIGKGVGEAVQPKTVAENLQAQARLDLKAGDYAKTHGDLRQIRKEEAFEDLTNAQAVDGDVFYDAADSAQKITAIEKKSGALADAALPEHNVLSPSGIQKEQLGLVPSGIGDAASRYFSNQSSVDGMKINSLSA